jgi:hypothetical protein
MSSNNLNLNVINYQNNLRSKPVRNNFTNIQTEFNALKAEVDAGIASTASEVVSARDNFSTLQNNINERGIYPNGISATAGYEVTNVSGLTVRVALGQGIVNGRGVFHNTSATASVSNPSAGQNRYDVLHINIDNTRTITAGTPTTGVAEIPSSSINQMPIARWHIFDTTGTLSNIVDLRYKPLDLMQSDEYSDANFSYTGDTLSTLGLLDTRNDRTVYSFNYTGDTLSTLGVDLKGKHLKGTYTYSGQTMTDFNWVMS